MAALLSPAELSVFLSQHPAWRHEGGMLRRSLELPSFVAAIALVNRIADAAERANHHPDIDIRYAKLELALATHDAGGLTRRDVALATEIDVLVAAQAG